jgi:chromosomal replication initiator protein
MNTDLWQRGCERLAAELPEQQFNTWIRPLSPLVSPLPLVSAGTTPGTAPGTTLPSVPSSLLASPGDGQAQVAADEGLNADADVDVITVQVANRFKLDWIRSQYAGRIESALAHVAGKPVRLALSLAPRNDPPASGLAGQRATDPGHVAQLVPQFAQPTGAGAWVDSRRLSPSSTSSSAPSGAGANGHGHAPAANPHRLNTALTFDSLVAGRANQMARTAALHVAGAPGAMYNPLFIYGGVGLGKTHLVHAVGNALLKDRPDARVLYLHAEQFISDVVKNYQRKTFDELKAKYHSLDLLLIDDVQFFAGKERTQEEFFNAFEALLTKRAHIIMTSDTYPKGLVDIDERLTSRFDAGLTVAIEAPELEMRVAILMRKAQLEGTEMPEDVAFFIAKNVRANVRELEGALRKVLAYSRFSHKDINIALARDALKDLLSIQNRQISVENIQKTVADFYKIKVADMYSKKRPASIARPRQIAMYLAKDMTKKSLPEIGELFGGRDHTTVLHAVRKIGAERTTNPELNQQLHVLEQTLKG